MRLGNVGSSTIRWEAFPISLTRSADVAEVEAAIPRDFGQDVKEIPGSRKLLAELDRAGAPWAIVTSGTKPFVTGWLEVLKLASPRKLVTAEDVQHGKPDPSCYLLGREKLGLRDKSNILVLEDAPAGVKAGKAAGFKVVALTTTHDAAQLEECGADWIVKDLRSIALGGWDAKKGAVTVEIRDALQQRGRGRKCSPPRAQY